ncbi:hypothetical protein E2I00_015279 [Balaenoptera physalus]|uniref:Uncharacterized protein n=1 Tax=Balaenoptera physalus TaxID=9770 RepID=A0A643CHE9_BALPH|nr:hypothetical protein E2I00_015279 [Balaenoptera physalus]
MKMIFTTGRGAREGTTSISGLKWMPDV